MLFLPGVVLSLPWAAMLVKHGFEFLPLLRGQNAIDLVLDPLPDLIEALMHVRPQLFEPGLALLEDLLDLLLLVRAQA